MTYYEPPQRPRHARRRSALDSPWLAGLLVVVVLGLVGTLFVGPALFGSPGSSAVGALPSGLLPSATTAGPSTEPTFLRPTPSPGPTFATYRVKKGDTLNTIAKKFHTTARSIAWWNRGAYPSLDPESYNYQPSTIRVGWTLVVLPGQVVDEANPPTPSPGPSGTPVAS
jgi:LysM domain